MSAPPVVAIALHDGYFSTGSGAGRSNRALLDAVVRALADGVRLVLLPVLLTPDSPEYDAAAHLAVRARLAAVPHRVIALENGTAGMQRFGDLTAFRQLARPPGTDGEGDGGRGVSE